ncbi:kinesin-like protein KIN-14P [Salvia hispanica]|uniref:kinesin-like protein KIN-14P n=1 Tax=Salvia hispanica TaxID=49212 RepID=UPI002009686E|nr:kinesin-like protein KIN-14P [Salvia hispanica]
MTASVISHAGHNFHDVMQLKHGSYADLPAAKMSEMMKSNSLDNAPIQSLLSVVNGILDEGVEMKSGAIPHRVACLLRKVVQEIERRICTQAENLRTQNNLFKAREENYQSRIRVLEALATGTRGETQVWKLFPFQLYNDKNKFEEEKKAEEHEASKLVNEKEYIYQGVANLRRRQEDTRGIQQELQERLPTENEAMKIGGDELEDKKKETQSLLAESRERIKQLEAMNAEIGVRQRELENRFKEAQNLLKESRDRVKELEEMKGGSEEELKDRLKEESRAGINKVEASDGHQELENKSNLLRESRERVKELETMKVEADNKQRELVQRLDEALTLVTQLKSRVQELEALLKSKSEWWKKKQTFNQIFIEHQLGVLPELKFASQEIKQEFRKIKESYSEEFNNLASKIKILGDAAKNYHPLLAENRKLHNELQELKGNIRVYCRIRPFLPGQKGKQTIIEYIGENGELTVANPAKPGKEGRRSFRFDKVYGPTSTQAQVFADTQPLIQSVLDGFNVCIFAYGQTGSGKTYTMTGPDGATEDEWGVNNRALKNLFTITQDRGSILQYEVSVQMVEIYNEQVRDLLSNDAQKKLGILTSSQPNGLAVPDASIEQVKSTEDVMRLMDIGLQNRAKSSTAMNERSSRSHSIVSIHTRGTDLKSGSSLRGSLHLVDLAGSERVDRSEVTGDRLKEAQHINKSLSALGDVVFALSQKAAHVPYRNSKLTQVLQSSLGGHAKTLMFVQMNPDATSFSETLSTLKFAERVSGVELGAAKSNKDNKDSYELMDQVTTLTESLAKKDEEIEALQKQVERKKVTDH